MNGQVSNSLVAKQPKVKFSVAIRSEGYQKLINDTLGDKEVARRFVAEISSVVANNPTLGECTPATVLSCGLMAQSLKLPLAQSLGKCYLIPFRNNKQGTTDCQFQIGWRGWIDLVQRSGTVKRIGVRNVHEGEYKGQDKFGEDIFEFSHDYDNAETIGYFAYVELINGFEKSIYWTKDQCIEHAKKYSKSYGTGKSTDNWTNMFDTMAQKTVIKQLVKWIPMSVELEKALKIDQAVVDLEKNEFSYVDGVDDSPREISPADVKSDDEQAIEEMNALGDLLHE